MYKRGEPSLQTGGLDSETDSKKPRHFQTVTFEGLFKLEKSSMPLGIGILGYAVDRSIALNKGRTGVEEGPDAVKQVFAGLSGLNQCGALVDYGNVHHDHEESIDTQKNLLRL